MAADIRNAAGSAMPRPAMSGADPCTGSNTAWPSPMFAADGTPSPPIRPAPRSDRMSPSRFSAAMTSKLSGDVISRMVTASALAISKSTSGNSAATSSTASRMIAPDSRRMFGLSAMVTRRSDGSAARPVSDAAVRSNRRHPKPVVTRRATAVSARVEWVTVGSCLTTSHSPLLSGPAIDRSWEYSPSVFSRTTVKPKRGDGVGAGPSSSEEAGEPAPASRSSTGRMLA